MPDVSVVIPTYNRLGLLEKAVRSCFIGNEEVDTEVIVVDDGSTDDTRSYLSNLDDERVRPFFQTHRGAQVARNRGIYEARGRIIKFLDSDDQLVEGMLEREVAALEASGAAINYGDLRIRESNGEEEVFRQSGASDLAAGIFEGAVWTHPHVFTYRREALSDVQWDPALSFEQDYAFAIQVATQGLSVSQVKYPVALFNRHTGKRISTTAKSDATNVEAFLLRVRLIEEGVRRLHERGLLNAFHRRAAARGMWRWTHMMAVYDFASFEVCYRRIQDVTPGFLPPRSSAMLRALDRVTSPRTTERVIHPLRKIKQLIAQ